MQIRQTPPVNNWRRFICIEPPLRRGPSPRLANSVHLAQDHYTFTGPGVLPYGFAWQQGLPERLTEEKTNGQGSTKKQPREEETETGEGKAYGQPVAVFRHAAEAHDRFINGQETIAPRSLEPSVRRKDKVILRAH